MATGKYNVTHPTVTDAVGGDPQTGTVWNTSWADDYDVELNASYDLIEDDIIALQQMTFLRGYDSVIYEHKDDATVTIKADGQFVADSNDKIYTVLVDTDVSFASNLSADVTGGEAASTLYYIWGGEDSNGDLEFWITDSPDTMPSELVKGKLLGPAIYNNSSSNILPFIIRNGVLLYDASINCDGSDVTEVYDGTIGTSASSIDCSSFIPAGARLVLVVMWLNDSSPSFFIRENGASNWAKVFFGYFGGAGNQISYVVPTDTDGIFEIKNDNSVSGRISVLGYHFH